MIIGRWGGHSQIMFLLHSCVSVLVLGVMLFVLGDRPWEFTLRFQVVLLCLWCMIGGNAPFLDKTYEAIGIWVQLKYKLNPLVAMGIGLLGVAHLLEFGQLKHAEMALLGTFLFLFIYSVRLLYLPVLKRLSGKKENAVYLGHALRGLDKLVIDKGLGMTGLRWCKIEY